MAYSSSRNFKPLIQKNEKNSTEYHHSFASQKQSRLLEKNKVKKGAQSCSFLGTKSDFNLSSFSAVEKVKMLNTVLLEIQQSKLGSTTSKNNRSDYLNPLSLKKSKSTHLMKKIPHGYLTAPQQSMIKHRNLLTSNIKEGGGAGGYQVRKKMESKRKRDENVISHVNFFQKKKHFDEIYGSKDEIRSIFAKNIMGYGDKNEQDVNLENDNRREEEGEGDKAREIILNKNLQKKSKFLNQKNNINLIKGSLISQSFASPTSANTESLNLAGFSPFTRHMKNPKIFQKSNKKNMNKSALFQIKFNESGSNYDSKSSIKGYTSPYSVKISNKKMIKSPKYSQKAKHYSVRKKLNPTEKREILGPAIHRNRLKKRGGAIIDHSDNREIEKINFENFKENFISFLTSCIKSPRENYVIFQEAVNLNPCCHLFRPYFSNFSLTQLLTYESLYRQDRELNSLSCLFTDFNEYLAQEHAQRVLEFSKKYLSSLAQTNKSKIKYKNKLISRKKNILKKNNRDYLSEVKVKLPFVYDVSETANFAFKNPIMGSIRLWENRGGIKFTQLSKTVKSKNDKVSEMLAKFPEQRGDLQAQMSPKEREYLRYEREGINIISSRDLFYGGGYKVDSK